MTCKVFAVRYSNRFHPACHDLEQSENEKSIANWLCNAVFRCVRHEPCDPILV